MFDKENDKRKQDCIALAKAKRIANFYVAPVRTSSRREVVPALLSSLFVSRSVSRSNKNTIHILSLVGASVSLITRKVPFSSKDYRFYPSGAL